MSFFSILFGLLAHSALAGSAGSTESLETRQSASITVNTAQTFQTIDGFGFSEAFSFVDGLFDLPNAAQTQGFNLLFDTTDGAALNIVRNRIPSGSDSIEPNNPGSPNAPPQYVPIGTDDNQIWFSQKAQSYGVKTFYADAWSAPGYMKTNGNESGGGYLCGVIGETCSSGDWRQPYADYLVQYIKDYQAAGIDITFVGFLNEPEFAATYSAMLSNGTQAASFIDILYPAIQAAGLSTGITCCDAEGWDSQKQFTAQLISAGVESKLARITSHSYTSKPDGPISTNLRVWQTEYADLDGTNVTSWYTNGGIGEGLTWANNIYQAVVISNCSAYLHWIGIQSGNSDASLIFIENNEPVATGKLWAFGQWSRYVQPGAVRLATTGSTSTLLTSAFKNTNGAISVQIINNGASAEIVSVSLTGATTGSATAFVSSISNNNISPLSVTISGGVVSGSVPALSMVTFLITTSGSSGASPPSTTTSTATPSTTSSASSTQQTHWGQCGGIGWTGLMSCQSPYICSVLNNYYSQCL